MVHPTPTTYFDSANELACRIINHLWHNWGSDDTGLRSGEVDLYNVNIPLIEGLLADGSLKVHWTTLWRNSYGRLFENISDSSESEDRTILLPAEESRTFHEVPEPKVSKKPNPLLFKWSPDIDHLINPTIDMLPLGSDGRAIFNGWASVTPLRAAFAESYHTGADAKGSELTMKL
jgi:broad specificity polyphosphatase/5'/3'-nucleotidase SurE